jgi:putative toxin-antitoxin system antitoxin component (TIGR02293 family)
MAHNQGQMSRPNMNREIALSETPIHLIGTVRKGFPADNLDRMALKLKVDRLVLVGVLGISERTAQRKHRHDELLSPSASDRLARIDRIFALAASVLGSEEKAAEWLKRPNRPLENETPLALLDTDLGSQEVERELRQIEFSFAY